MLKFLASACNLTQNGPGRRPARWLLLLGVGVLVVPAIAVMLWPLRTSPEKADSLTHAGHKSTPIRFVSSALADPTPVVGASARGMLEVAGRTQPAHNRQALITSIVLHPIVAVFVAPGDRVKAGQKLIEMDRDEPEAEVRSRKAEVVELEASLARIKAMPRAEERAKAKAELEAARATAKGANEQLARLTPLLDRGAVAPGQELHARTASLHAEASERAAAAHLDYLLKLPVPQEIAEMEARLATAKADLEASQAELEHYTLFAPIDGVVSWLEAPLGRANRPGTTVWGEIIDLHEIDVRCEVTPEQADGIVPQTPAELIWPEKNGDHWTGRVVFVSPAADAQTGLVPVVASFDNSKERLRANISVKVRILPQSGLGSGDVPSRSEGGIPRS